LKNLKKELQERKAGHLYRTRRIADGPQQPGMVIDGKHVISFCSNDYLGLANHPEVKQAFINGIKKYGAGSGSAHLVNGHSKAHHLLEEELAEFTGYPRALLFSTGYMANLGVAQALINKGDTVLEDRLNHASLIDGGLLSGARLMRYMHNDTSDLNNKLASRTTGEKLVMTDGVFSMDGDIAHMTSLTETCKKNNATLMVDDAHGFGVLGTEGKGVLESTKTSAQDAPVYMATLGKAVGTSGAFVAGSENIIETLIQKARTYIYTTATPPALAEATRSSLKIIKNATDLREQLNKNIQYFRLCCQQQRIELSGSKTAIQPILTGDEKTTVELSEKLFNKNILVTAIRPPTVPEGTARLRVTLSAAHSTEQIDQLVDALTI
jgi:8-amino-7-oxononanoate synthase